MPRYESIMDTSPHCVLSCFVCTIMVLQVLEADASISIQCHSNHLLPQFPISTSGHTGSTGLKKLIRYMQPIGCQTPAPC